jgi:hypothetical protein
VAFVVGAILFPALLFLIAMAIRHYKNAPLTSAADFVALFLLFDGLLLTDPSQVLTHMPVHYGAEAVVATTLLFLTISFAVWFFCLFDLEPRITEYYTNKDVFSLKRWLATWAVSLAVVVLQIAFLTGRPLLDQSGQRRILAGSQLNIPPAQINAVFFTHMHSDHAATTSGRTPGHSGASTDG